uniref:Ig-like domain-containing protein n=1 Tax=Oryzias latipes TaxID=8090 RepID=A0A3P9LL20_ORYLA
TSGRDCWRNCCIYCQSVQFPRSLHSVYLLTLTSFLPFSSTVKPVFKDRVVPLEVNAGSTARFECETEFAPNVSFKWSKDGHPIKASDKCRIISRFTASSLELLSPTQDDSGEYSCEASNQHGIGSSRPTRPFCFNDL